MKREILEVGRDAIYSSLLIKREILVFVFIQLYWIIFFFLLFLWQKILESSLRITWYESLANKSFWNCNKIINKKNRRKKQEKCTLGHVCFILLNVSFVLLSGFDYLFAILKFFVNTACGLSKVNSSSFFFTCLK
jgi:hypothetical protein